MAEGFENKHVDKRVVARYIHKGIVDEKEFEASLKKLPDLEADAIPVESEFEDTAED
jgi:hypothetical protein